MWQIVFSSLTLFYTGFLPTLFYTMEGGLFALLSNFSCKHAMSKIFLPVDRIFLVLIGTKFAAITSLDCW